MIFHSHPDRTTTLHRLRAHQALSLRRPKGVCVRAERGSLWVTVEGELADIELSTGDSHLFKGPEKAVVSPARGDAVASVAMNAAPAWTHRLKRWIRSLAHLEPA